MRLALPILAVASLPLAFSQSITTITSNDSPTTSSASYSTDSSTPTPTTSLPLTITVSVALGGFIYVPDVVQISPGNYIEFDFYPENHSVIRAEYLHPCIPYEDTGIDKIGFFSGFHPVDAVLTDPPKWSLLINDSDPIFYYCGAPNSCIGHQMVGVINPNSSVSLQVQKEYAANSSFMLLPGQDWPNEQDPFSTTSTSTSTAVLTTTVTSTFSPSPTLMSSSSVSTATAAPIVYHSTTLSEGAIAGIAIGAAAVAIAAIALLFFCVRRSRRREDNPPGPTTPAMGPVLNPPGYMSPNIYGYMSSANKHMSASTVPPTDALGNPIPNGGMYWYPANYQPGYPPPPVQQNTLAMQNQPHSSPTSDIFGPIATPQHETQLFVGSVTGTEAHSVRANSPTSVNAAAPALTTCGIQGFLQRQECMNPSLENEVQSSSALPQDRPGPYEMSAIGTLYRST